MGLVAALKDFVRTVRNGANVSDAKGDPGGGALNNADHFQAPGTDAHPIPGVDFLFLVDAQGKRLAAIGYLDPSNEQLAQVGEHRTYSRDEDGSRVAQIWLKNDGTILVENDAVSTTLNPDGSARTENGNGYHELRPDGVVEANGATIPTDGDVITASGVSLDNHTHAQGNDSGGSTEQETEKPTV